MKTISVRALKAGMILARPVLDKNREILLDSGVAISEEYIKKLKERKIRMVSVLEEDLEDENDEVEEEEEEEELSDSAAELVESLKGLSGLPFQEAYEKLKKVEKKVDEEGVELAIVTYLKVADNEKLIEKCVQIL